jgi:hypothetical protein
MVVHVEVSVFSYPALHAHVNEPTVLLHAAFACRGHSSAKHRELQTCPPAHGVTHIRVAVMGADAALVHVRAADGVDPLVPRIAHTGVRPSRVVARCVRLPCQPHFNKGYLPNLGSRLLPPGRRERRCHTRPHQSILLGGHESQIAACIRRRTCSL